ncbi:MAG: restriction endonuclease subunit S [Fimbriimonadaceae bacterium]|nr:restriction endonuclease subunit S [Fimbriimonadaceae bacterium]
MCRISSVADIRSGFQFRESVEAVLGGCVGVIQIKDFSDRKQLSVSSIERTNLDKAYSASLVRRGDVLFLSRGHRPFAVHIDLDLVNTIASGQFYILSGIHPSVRPAYLSWILNQRPMQDLFKQLAKGTHMPFVSMAEFRELDIPIPPLSVQEHIVALAALADEEQAILAQIAEKRAHLIQSTCLTAAGATPVRR